MKIGLYLRYVEEQWRPQLDLLTGALHRNNVETEEIGDVLPSTDYDFIFSIGGDGTLLSSVHLIGSLGIPVVGLNFGHLGFLTTVGRDNVSGFVEDLLAGRYFVEERTLLQVQASAEGKPAVSSFALNEATLHRTQNQALMLTDLYVDGDFVSTYAADGLIVATPTGSTAYSLSCGGPILTPNSGCFVITPIAAHNLTLRPIIVPDTATIRLVTDPRHEGILLYSDFYCQPLPASAEVTLCRENFTVKLVRLSSQSFFSAIHEKLSWGTDDRHWPK